MRFLLTDDHWMLDVLFPGEWEWLCMLPHHAAGKDFRASSHERLFPSPLPPDTLADEDAIQQLEDWDELIRPELIEGFTKAREIVEKDLTSCIKLSSEEFAKTDPLFAELEESGFPPDFFELFRITVPLEHTDAWYSTLNQARLLMNEEYGLATIDRRKLAQLAESESTSEEKQLPIYQYEVYSILQSMLLENVMDA